MYGCACMHAGPKLKFHVASVVALTGAEYEADLDGSAVNFWKSFTVSAGSVLTVGKVCPCALKGSLGASFLMAYRFAVQKLHA